MPLRFQFLKSLALLLFSYFFTQALHAQVETNFASGGAVRVGDSTTTCDASIEGAIRFDADGADTIDYCNGTSWLTLLTSALAGDINNGGNTTGAAITIGTNDNFALNFETNNSTAMTIDTSGNVGIGTATPSANLHVYESSSTANLTISGFNGASTTTTSTSAGNNPSTMNLVKYGIAGTPSANDDLGIISFHGGDSSWSYLTGAEIKASIVGTPSDTSMPTSLYFRTTPSASTTPATRMYIDPDGNVGIGTIAPAVELDINTGTLNAAQICDESNTNCKDISSGWGAASDIDGLSDAITNYTNNNIFVGSGSGGSVTSAVNATALGEGALASLTTGSGNTAIGYNAANGNDTGTDITAIGDRALENNNWNNNTAVGASAGMNTTAGWGNTMVGYSAFGNATNGSTNTAIGQSAMWNVGSVADDNAALGVDALWGTQGDRNVGLGKDAGRGTASAANNNVFVGYRAGYNRTTSDNNIMIGYQAGDLTTTGDNNILIGYDIDASSATASSELNIGNTIYGNLTNGYVGIGTAAPGKLLDIEGTNGDAHIHLTRTGGSTDSATFYLGNYADTSPTTGSTFMGMGSKGSFASPAPLINGDIAFFLLGQGATDTSWNTRDLAQIEFVADENINNTSSAGRLAFLTTTSGSTTPTEKVRIDNQGNVGIGTTSPAGILHVYGGATGSIVGVFHNTDTGTGADGIAIRTGPNTNPGSSNHFIQFYDGDGTQIGKVQGNGSGGVTYATTSDRRIKRNIRDTHYTLDDLLKIRVRDYNPLQSSKEVTGFIAQELYEVYPHASFPGEKEEDIWTVDYSQLTPLLTKGVQDLHGICVATKKDLQKINDLSLQNKRDIASLKKENEELKNQIKILFEEVRKLKERR